MLVTLIHVADILGFVIFSLGDWPRDGADIILNRGSCNNVRNIDKL